MIDYARANNVTHLIVSKSNRPPWWQWLCGSITQRLINRAGGIAGPGSLGAPAPSTVGAAS